MVAGQDGRERVSSGHLWAAVEEEWGWARRHTRLALRRPPGSRFLPGLKAFYIMRPTREDTFKKDTC